MPNKNLTDDTRDTRNMPPAEPDRKTNPSRDREPEEGSRFDKERQDRDRGAYESHNQGSGPNNVGDQSRTR